jgi:hypothetical protein
LIWQEIRTVRVGALVCLLAASIGGVVYAKDGRESLPGLSVLDLIGMSRFGSRLAGAEGNDDGVYSPNREHVVVVTQRGIVRDNVREFSLWLLDTRSRTAPRALASFETSSNRAGIYQVSWLSNDRVTFLGELRDGLPQVYSLDIDRPAPIQVTHSNLPIDAFSTSEDGSTTAFVTADPPPDTTAFASMRAHGFVIPPDFPLSAAMLGKWEPLLPQSRLAKVIHVVRGGMESTVPLPDATQFGDLYRGETGFFEVSPHGSYALLLTMPRKTPKEWTAYTYDNFVKGLARGGSYASWVMVDLQTGSARPLTGGPIMEGAPLVWTDDDHVLLVNALLPLAGLTGTELQARASTPMTAELDVRSGEATIIEPTDHFGMSDWDARSSMLMLQPMKRNGGAGEPVNGEAGARVAFRKTPEGWLPMAPDREVASGKIEILQGLNRPWALVLSKPSMDHTSNAVVFNPNLSAGLYWPLDYQPGKRYPILLQTHGFDPKKFAPDGYSTTGYAAQPLAAAGMFVAQIGACEDCENNPERNALNEGERIVEGWDSLIDYLDQQGLIDPRLVGIHGYSRSSYWELYYLTHTSHPVAAGNCTDGVDMSYLQYLVFGMSSEGYAKTVELQNGGKPWGKGLKSWSERAPGLLLDRIHTPLRLTAMSDPGGLLEEWEPFAGLRLQGKPVELFYQPDTVHNIVKPWERFASQQGTVDWFRFWLLGYERTEPVIDAEETSEQLRDQYARWHKLRALRDADVAHRVQ